MLAVIGGTGLSRLQGFQAQQQRMIETPYGMPSAALGIGRYAGQEVVFLPRHGDPHVIPPHQINYRANLHALQATGVDRILAINAVGGINTSMGTGHIVIPHDLVDYSWGREHTFSDGQPSSFLRHIDFTEPFDAGMRKALARCLAQTGFAFSAEGVYAVTQGPRLETAAEIRRCERDGCDIVGMTAMPEAALARELGLRYAMLCLVVNPAAGKAAGAITLEDMNRVLDAGMEKILAVLAAFIADNQT